MIPGQPSQTAVLVARARALAHESALAPRFSDPTALELLPEKDREEIVKQRQGPPKGGASRVRYEMNRGRAAMMVVRTAFIDEVVREAAAPQVVILGAGLDGRAWRMPELENAVVFEVDHPDSQSYKRARVGTLTRVAREVRFVTVDFTRDDLAQALEAAGHDATRPTTWIWEGVVMYLTPAEVAATLARIRQRSAPASSLVIVYHAPGRFLLRIVGFIVRRMGEPLRSTFSADAMRALLAEHGFSVSRDENLLDAAERLAPNLTKQARHVKHMRLVNAARS